MGDCTRTQMQEPPTAAEVAQALDDGENVPPCDSPVSPSDVARDTEPSSDAERAADAANEPQPGGSPDAPSKPTTNISTMHDWRDGYGSDLERDEGSIDNSDNESAMSDARISVFDQGGTLASSAASDFNDDRDGESVLPGASDYTDDGDADSTLSLDSKSFEYVEVNGRKYHAEPQGESCRYLWPNDERQKESLDIFHAAALCVLDDQLYKAPIKDDVQAVLDAGTGTGTWAIHFAEAHPGAHVIGTDISPIQPSWVPPNLEFQIDDVNLEWTFGERFEFIHARRMAGSITDWRKFADEAFGASKRGGYFECYEVSMRFISDDRTLEDCESMIQWGGFWKDVGTKLNRSFTVAEDGTLEKSMESAGFTDIETRVYKMPVGRWPKDSRLKEVGRYTRAALVTDLEGFVLRPATEVLGWSPEKAILFAAGLRKELQSGEVHAYILLRVVFGRKPE